MMLASTRVQRTSFSADVRSKAATRVQARSPMVVRASSIAAEDVPSPEKRGIMNLLLAGAVGLPVSSLRCPTLKPLLVVAIVGHGLAVEYIFLED